METHEQRLRRADRLAAITQNIGFSLWQIQALEDVAAHYFVMLVRAKSGMGLSDGIALLKKAQSKTFGATIREISEAGLLSSELRDRFNKLLSERNWLVHNSRVTSRSTTYSDAAADLIIRRLNSMADEASALANVLSGLAERFVRQRGMSQEAIDDAAKELLRQWHQSS